MPPSQLSVGNGHKEGSVHDLHSENETDILSQTNRGTIARAILNGLLRRNGMHRGLSQVPSWTELKIAWEKEKNQKARRGHYAHLWKTLPWKSVVKKKVTHGMNKYTRFKDNTVYNLFNNNTGKCQVWNLEMFDDFPLRCTSILCEDIVQDFIQSQYSSIAKPTWTSIHTKVSAAECRGR